MKAKAKIVLSLALVLIITVTLSGGCTDSGKSSGSGSSTATSTTKAETTTSTEPEPSVKIEDTTYDANKEFSKTDANDPNTVWSYMYTIDSGETYELNNAYNAEFNTWYPVGEMWFGIGINPAETAGEFEVIADSDTMWSALTFTAPSDGEFTIQPFEVFSPFNEPAHIFKVIVNNEIKFETKPGELSYEEGEEVKKVSVKETKVTLKKGEIIRFHGQGENPKSFACYDMSQLKIDAKYS